MSKLGDTLHSAAWNFGTGIANFFTSPDQYGFTGFNRFMDDVFNGGNSYRQAVWRSEDIARENAQIENAQVREDTAYQRGVSDMRAAGLNPLSTTASAASSSAGVGTMASATPVQGSSPAAAIGSIMSFISGLNELRAQNASIAKTKAETYGILGNNQFSDDTYKMRVMQQRLLTMKSDQELSDILRDSNYMRMFGLTPSMSDKEKLLNIIKTYLGAGPDPDSITYQTYDFKNPYGVLARGPRNVFDINGSGQAEYRYSKFDIKKILESFGVSPDKLSSLSENPLIKALLSLGI